MRGLQIFLNHTQQTRLKNAQKTLESLSSKANYDASVAVGDTVPFSYEDGVLKYIISDYPYIIKVWIVVYLPGDYMH